jgi:hypothetical protein
VNYTGPPVMPYLTFAGDQDHELGGVFAAQALHGGAYLHPRHNWFVSAALTGDDLALAPTPFHGADKVLGYGLAVAAAWYFGGLLWRLKKGTAGVKPVEDLVDRPRP